MSTASHRFGWYLAVLQCFSRMLDDLRHLSAEACCNRRHRAESRNFYSHARSGDIHDLRFRDWSGSRQGDAHGDGRHRLQRQSKSRPKTAADVVLGGGRCGLTLFGSRARQTLGDALGRHCGLWEAGCIKRAPYQARSLRNFEQITRNL